MVLDRRLAPWLSAPATAGVLCDFDGTLSPIVPDPDLAAALPGTAERLATLARRYRKVAVISGRPVAFLAEQLGPLPGVVLAGLYGLETDDGGTIRVAPEAGQWRQAVQDVAAAAEAEAPAGVYVERKGLAVALHARRAPAHAAWIERWAAEQSRRWGLRLQSAKLAVELLPPVPADKGRVVTELAAGLSAVCYLGDDLGDLPAFAALRRLSVQSVATLSVAVRSAESPPELVDQADVVVDGPEGALAWLDQLVRP